MFETALGQHLPPSTDSSVTLADHTGLMVVGQSSFAGSSTRNSMPKRLCDTSCGSSVLGRLFTRSSAIAEGSRDALDGRQVYLLTPIDRAMLPHAKSPMPHCTPSEITRQQRFEQYLKHIATQTCRLLAHICTVKPKVHLVDLLSTYYTRNFAKKYTRN